MEGDIEQRTPQPGKIMFPTHQMEARDAKHEKDKPSRAKTRPPAAKGGRSPAKTPAGELIAQNRRPSFFQLLTALWGAEDEIDQKRARNERKPKRPRRKVPKQEEKP